MYNRSTNSFRSLLKDNSEKSKKPWKYTEDGSISGVLGGGTTNGSSSGIGFFETMFNPVIYSL